MSKYKAVDYERVFTILDPVDNESGCHSVPKDQLKIVRGSGTSVTLEYIDTTGKNKSFVDFWKDHTADIDEKRSIITGTVGKGDFQREFSIAMDHFTMNPYRIHVFVSANKQKGGGGAPDDGSWTGVGN